MDDFIRMLAREMLTKNATEIIKAWRPVALRDMIMEDAKTIQTNPPVPTWVEEAYGTLTAFNEAAHTKLHQFLHDDPQGIRIVEAFQTDPEALEILKKFILTPDERDIHEKQASQNTEKS